MKNYSYANGMLLGVKELNYFNEPYKALKGNVLSGFKVFITSLKNYIIGNSNMLKITRAVFSKNLLNQQRDKSLYYENKLTNVISNKMKLIRKYLPIFGVAGL